MQRSRERWTAVVGLVALTAIAIGSVLALAPSPRRGADAPAADFSAARAMGHIAAVAGAPRPPGSAAHARAREYLVAQLASHGWRVEVQEAVGATDVLGPGTQPLAAVANVVATLPGRASTGTVLLAAHYDTVAGSPGAADDGIGVGTLLELARALRTPGVAPRNDLMILLTDGEENGLLGAEAFVRERAAPSAPRWS
jgi:acetylornithine deacetylase/succinyl-diaminopimelate desuccinylase-like protein